MLQKGFTRAGIFLENNNYDDIQGKIFEKLAVKNLNELRERYPDAYNFLLSLKNRLNEMGDFANEE